MLENVVQSEDGAHRYLLRRQVSGEPGSVLVIIHHPTLDDADTDPITARIVELAAGWPGIGTVYIASRFSLRRATDDGLWDGDPVNTEDSLPYIMACASEIDAATRAAWSDAEDAENFAGVVLAWGAIDAPESDDAAQRSMSVATATLMRALIQGEIELDVLGYDPVSGSPLSPTDIQGDIVERTPYE